MRRLGFIVIDVIIIFFGFSGLEVRQWVIAQKSGDFYNLHLLDFVVPILELLRDRASQWILVFNSSLYLGSGIICIPVLLSLNGYNYMDNYHNYCFIID